MLYELAVVASRYCAASSQSSRVRTSMPGSHGPLAVLPHPAVSSMTQHSTSARGCCGGDKGGEDGGCGGKGGGEGEGGEGGGGVGGGLGGGGVGEWGVQ